MRVDVLQVLRLGAVDVAGDIEVVVVLRIAISAIGTMREYRGDLDLLVKASTILWMSWRAQAVLVAVLDEALARHRS